MQTTRVCSTLLLLTAVAAIGCNSVPNASEQPRTPISTASVNRAPANASGAIQLASAQEPAKEKDPPQKKDDKAEQKEKIDLPKAIQLCTLQNFRLQVSATKIAQAEADLVTASLIPNPSLYADLQLIPLQRANIDNQLGPPQQDAIFSIPIDWLMFGKRAAAMQVQQLGISVTRADHDNNIRRAVSDTVDTFYAVLFAEEMLKLAEAEYEHAKQLQSNVAKLVAAGKAGDFETNRAKLDVLETHLNVHARELDLASAKAKLRPLIGRTAADADFDVVGTLDVKAVVPVPELRSALVLAEARRPDLLSDRNSIAQAGASVHSEKRKAKPQVALTPGWSYQYQRNITGYRNGSMLDVGVLFTLPITDRNQGNIRKAEWQLAEARYTHLADVAEVRAEVEIVIATYSDAVEDITENNDPATLKAAIELRKRAETEFLAGQRKMTEVLDARRAAIERQIRNVEFHAVYWRVLNRLNTVVGLGSYDHATGATIPVEYGKDKKEDKKCKMDDSAPTADGQRENRP